MSLAEEGDQGGPSSISYCGDIAMHLTERVKWILGVELKQRGKRLGDNGYLGHLQLKHFSGTSSTHRKGVGGTG